ncbi:PREDICTED: peroxidase 20 isoform X2 [Tarenaya hassleriana]|nr:PREDICTED: peroxidase 20 isoform X2 [Tarenaya hassleriana]XP_010518875.1 PREDICTED: peroxidase 20 isoform X2 [Tarenaya hassleriana]
MKVWIAVMAFWGIIDGSDGNLMKGYYKETCPLAEEIVRHNVQVAILRDPRMAASLLRLHFHDCFVLGCDGSVLLDTKGEMVSEKEATPNANSLRGFEVIDYIKYLLEEACPLTVSCSDILAMAARDSVFLRNGPWWEVLLGRRDSLKASLEGANRYIPAPNSSLEGLIANFKEQGLDVDDLIALSGAHTMGKARCVSFKQRITQPNTEQTFYDDRFKRHDTFRRVLRAQCRDSTRDNLLTPLDIVTPSNFDNHYFVNLLRGRGLLISDNVLVSEDHEGYVFKRVWDYAVDRDLFFADFAESMLKMGSINVLTGVDGEIRKSCRFVNAWI